MGGTPKWLVFNGQSHQNGGFGGTPISGNHHVECDFSIHLQGLFGRLVLLSPDSSPIFHTDACPKGAVVSILHQSRASNRPPT